MEKRLWITLLACLALAACEPRGTPQKPKMAEHATAVVPGH
jgi:hypothetical protein